MPEKKDGFTQNINKFFKRVQNKDLIDFSTNNINTFNAPASADELKRKSEFSVFRQYLQAKNWSTKHIELFDEYRKMDQTYPIINAALRLYCVTGDTRVMTPMGDFTIDQLIRDKKHHVPFYVHSYDNINGRTDWNIAQTIISNGVKPVYKVIVQRITDEITFKSDTKLEASFTCTMNHKIMMPDGRSFKTLEELKVGDEIFGLYKTIDPSCSCKVNVFTKTPILSIEYAGEQIVYDLFNVAPTNHFSAKLTDSFFVELHNCQEVCTKDNDGNVLKVISNEKPVKKALEECFFDNLKMNSQGYLLSKEMMKFGNLFCYLNTRRGVGVTDLIHLPPEAFRIQLLANAPELDSFKYTWYGAGGGLQFEPWEIVHWKIIEDIEMQPYGTSILRSVVDTWRRIVLLRESLIIYRITRAPQRFLFKMDTTGMDPDAASKYADEMKKKLDKKPFINPHTGELDFKYNTMPLSWKTPVALLDSRVLNLKELADEYEQGKTNYVYSIKDHTHEIVPGKIVWAGKNYTANKLIRIWLDNGSYIDSAPEHPFILRNGMKVKAEDLKENDSLMPFYRKLEKIRSDSNTTYEQVYNPATEKFEFTHRLIAKDVEKSKETYNTVHHIDFQRYNNRPDNLKWVDYYEHKQMHREMASVNNKNRESWRHMFNALNNNPELREKQKKAASEGQIKSWEKDRDYRKETMTTYFNVKIWTGLSGFIENKKGVTNAQAAKFVNSTYKKELEKTNPTISKIKITPEILVARIVEMGYSGFEEFVAEIQKISKKEVRGNTISVIRLDHFKNNPGASAYISETNKKLGKTKVMQKKYLEMIANGELSFKGDKNPNFKGLAPKEEILEFLGFRYFKNIKEMIEVVKTKFPDKKQHFTAKRMSAHLEMSVEDFNERYFSKEKQGVYMNHKIARIEVLENVNEDVYCMTIEGANGENDRHNFMICGLKANNEVTDISTGVSTCNSISENFYLPSFEGDVSNIEILQGATNMNDLEDYNLIRDDLYTGLLIPKSFLTMESDLSNKAALCLRHNTKFLTSDGVKEMWELAWEFDKDPNKKIFALSCNQYGIISTGKIKWCKQTVLTNVMYEIEVNHKDKIETTDNHPFMMDDLTYKRADELCVGNNLKGIYEKDYIVTSVKRIVLDETEPFYDLEVDEYHNFALECGIFVHNSQEDVRFAGAIKQYQSYFIEGLLHIALVHLHINGYAKDDLESFSIEMNVNSTLAEKTRNELLQQRLDLAKGFVDDSQGLSLMSMTQAMKEVLKFSDIEIAKIFKDQMIEKKLIWRLNTLKEQGFYEEPEVEKRRAIMKGVDQGNDVFAGLKFEASEHFPQVKAILTEKLDQELSYLTRKTKIQASKKIIDEITSVKPSEYEKNRGRFLRDIRLND